MPAIWWSACRDARSGGAVEPVIAVHDALDELLFCIRRAHSDVLRDHDRWGDLVENPTNTPGDLEDDL